MKMSEGLIKIKKKTAMLFYNFPVSVSIHDKCIVLFYNVFFERGKERECASEREKQCSRYIITDIVSCR